MQSIIFLIITQETFLIIIKIENNFAALYFYFVWCVNGDALYFSEFFINI